MKIIRFFQLIQWPMVFFTFGIATTILINVVEEKLKNHIWPDWQLMTPIILVIVGVIAIFTKIYMDQIRKLIENQKS